jgi:hypothetical protein
MEGAIVGEPEVRHATTGMAVAPAGRPRAHRRTAGSAGSGSGLSGGPAADRPGPGPAELVDVGRLRPRRCAGRHPGGAQAARRDPAKRFWWAISFAALSIGAGYLIQLGIAEDADELIAPVVQVLVAGPTAVVVVVCACAR